jgi:hypothetical protein
MNVLLDGMPIDAPGESLESALREGARAAAAKGRMIVELEVDGAMLWGDALADAMSGGSHALPQQVSLVSADPRSLARLTLLDAAEGLESSRADHQAAAEELQVGDNAVAIGRLGSVFGAWQNARDAFQRSTKLLGLSPDAVSAQDAAGKTVSAAECATSLARRLHSARGSMESGDWSSLADTLAYDLTEEIGVWTSLLRATADRIAGTL